MPGKEISSLRLIITSNCNLKCNFCFKEGCIGIPDTIDIALIKQIVSYASKNKIPKFQITGGEPLLSPLLGPALEELNKANDIADVLITTNGTLPDKINELLPLISVKTRVNVSIPSLKKDEYNSITGENYLDKVKETIGILKDRKIDVKINSILLRKYFNEMHLQELIDYSITNRIPLRFLELIVDKKLNEEKVSWDDRIGINEFMEYMGKLKYAESYEEKRKKGFRNTEIGHSLSFVKCCPSTCGSCLETMSCIRVTNSGELKSCLLKDKYLPLCNKSSNEINAIFDEAVVQIKSNMAYTKYNYTTHEEVLLFVSFDLSNSTDFKIHNYRNWHKLFSHVFDNLRNEMSDNESDLAFWRSIGDQIVFFKSITDLEALYSDIDTISRKFHKLIRSIKNGNIFKEAGMEAFDNELFMTYNSVFIKSTAWIAPIYFIDDLKNVDFDLYNIGYSFINNFEFQGNDIDTGFRIASNSLEKDLTVSFELAYLLKDKTDLLNKMILTDYTSFKGVWNNKPYPMIHFRHDSEAPKGMYYLDNKLPVVQNELYNKLNTICDDRNLQNKIDHIKKVISNYKINKESYITKSVNSNQIDLHLVAICLKYNGESPTEVLMFTRENQDEVQYDFGYCKLIASSTSDSLPNIIENQYKKLYGVDISVKDPFKVYHYPKEFENVLGIRFLAKIRGKRVSINKSETPYTKAEFFKISDIKMNIEEFAAKFIEPDQFIEVINFIDSNQRVS